MYLDIYTEKRKRLIKDFDYLTKKGVMIRAPYQIFLSIRELEEMESVERPDVMKIDNELKSYNFYSTTPAKLMHLIKKLDNSTSISFRHPEDAITIYETIIRYLNNWMDIAIEIPSFQIPDIKELYALEDLALWLFKIYKPTMVYRFRKRQRSLNQNISKSKTPEEVLMALGIIEDKTETGNYTFSSILEARLPQQLKDYYRMVDASTKDDWLLDKNLFN